MFNKTRASILSVAVVPMLLATQASYAALDAGITTAVEGAETDLLALYALLTGVGAAIFVARIIYTRFFKIG